MDMKHFGLTNLLRLRRDELDGGSGDDGILNRSEGMFGSVDTCCTRFIEANQLHEAGALLLFRLGSRMQVSLARQIRTVLDGASDALSLDELLVLVDDFVVECSSSEEPHVLISYLEDDLQATHHQVVDYSDLRQAEIFLTILHRLSPVIPSTSIIAWFEIVFRPALREPKLATVYINLAKELIIKALKSDNDVYADKIENYAERVAGFRKRLFDYYLLDVFNENSVDDVLEWAGMDETEQRERACWKDNLEDILIKYGQEHPEVDSRSLWPMSLLIQKSGTFHRNSYAIRKPVRTSPALHAVECAVIPTILQ